jgi:hypothetical protein
MPGILSSDKINLTQCLQRALRDITEIANGGGNYK